MYKLYGAILKENVAPTLWRVPDRETQYDGGLVYSPATVWLRENHLEWSLLT